MTTPLPHARHHYTYEEYLAYERDSELKHEFEAGEILAMAGGSPRHSALASRISAALENTRPSGCTAFQSDMRIRVLATGKATYPDVSMVCGVIELDAADRSGTTITIPRSSSKSFLPRPKKWTGEQVARLSTHSVAARVRPR
jgi:Uma2 family endonuclease